MVLGGSWRTCNGGHYFPEVHPTLSLKIHSPENAIHPPCEVFCSHTFICRNSNPYKYHTVFQYICMHGNEIFFLKIVAYIKQKIFRNVSRVLKTNGGDK